MPAVKTPVDVAAAVWKPLLFRAVTAAAFGALTVFWQVPTVQVMAFALAAYLVLTAKSVRDFTAAEVVPAGVKTLLGLSALIWVLSAVLMLVFQDMAAATAGVVLVLTGALETAAWLRHRKELVPARELAVTGLASLGSGAGMLLGLHLDPHGLLGIAGGGAIIIAVFLLIAGFGYRHDAQAGEQPT